MLKIGLTGGIGSGKSTVAKVLEVLGVPVYYADEAAKELMHSNELLKQQLILHFGKETYFEDGQLNRKHLSSIVFNNKEKLELLNSLVHPATIADAKEWFSKQHSPYVVKEAALLFESGTAEGLDYIIGVTAPIALRIKRVMDRDGVTADEVKRRMANQVDEALKMKLCDFVVHNNEQELLLPLVLALHNELIKRSTEQ
ncbi:dephospho-CoA kinase [Lacibacter sediminis]|uniref:Dephospho-CoA kinase n=1 Tax=Lacibacter sediminis TaxID=2760713 RepID=A0A7G5XDI8_9BACT|nr:dephospho-CoA kinase [Lacibacter sediminis]QNA43541.1 dephospho-CoA kinase [Lacibacter sediminis]